MFRKKSLLILFVLFWLCGPLMAQDEDALPTADYELDTAIKVPTNEMRLTKNYATYKPAFVRLTASPCQEGVIQWESLYKVPILFL